MTTIQVSAAGSKLIAFNSASVKRSASDLVTTADISAPLDIISELETDQEIAIEIDSKVIFHGIAGDWKLNYSGGNTSISIPCVDLLYKLSHMLAVEPGTIVFNSGTAVSGSAVAIQLDPGASATDDYYIGLMIEITGGTGSGQTRLIYDYTGSTNFAAVTPAWTTQPDATSTYRMFRGYAEGSDLGDIIYDLLADTGINRSHINQTTGILLSDAYEIATGVMRDAVIADLTKLYNCLFYLSFGKVGASYVTYGEFDTYDNMEASGEFVEEYSLTDANTPIFNLGISKVSGTDVTRVIVYRDIAGVQEVGVATYGSAPYLDKVVNAGQPATVRSGTALSGTSVSIQLETDAPAVDDAYVGLVIALTGGTGSGQVRVISDYTGSTRFAAVSTAWTTAPDATSAYTIYAGYSDVNDIASDTLTNLRRGVNKLDLSFSNLGIGIFNIVDLSTICDVLGVTLPLEEFRVTDLTYDISASGITTKCTGVDPLVKLWDRTTRFEVSEQTVSNVVQIEAEYQAEEAKPVYAEVIA